MAKRVPERAGLTNQRAVHEAESVRSGPFSPPLEVSVIHPSSRGVSHTSPLDFAMALRGLEAVGLLDFEGVLIPSPVDVGEGVLVLE